MTTRPQFYIMKLSEPMNYKRRRGGGFVMKKLAIGMLAIALLFSITALAAEKGKAVTVKGWVSDTECATHGDKKCANKDHIKMGSKLALSTDGDNKIWAVENPNKLSNSPRHSPQLTPLPTPQPHT